MRTPVTAVTSNILQRTLYVGSGSRRGAAFAVEVNGRQVLLTAKHIFDGSPTDHMLAFHEAEWKRLTCKVYFARYGVDLVQRRNRLIPLSLPGLTRQSTLEPAPVLRVDARIKSGHDK